MKKILLLLSLVSFSVNARAGVYIDPFLGLDSSTVTATTASGAKANSSSSGIDYGARLGYKLMSPWFIAAEYTGGSGKDDGGTSSSSEYTKTALGGVIGYDIGKHLLAIGYGFSDKLKYKTTPELEISGTNLKLGYAYKATNKININLDLIIPNYTKASAGGGEVEISQVYSKFTVTTILLSVSFPIGYSK